MVLRQRQICSLGYRPAAGQYRQQIDFPAVIQPSDKETWLGTRSSSTRRTRQFESGLRRADGALSVEARVSLSTGMRTGWRQVLSADAVNKAQLDAAIPIGAIIASGGRHPAASGIFRTVRCMARCVAVRASANALTARQVHSGGVRTYARNSTASTAHVVGGRVRVPAQYAPRGARLLRRRSITTRGRRRTSQRIITTPSANIPHDGVHNHSIPDLLRPVARRAVGNGYGGYVGGALAGVIQ